MIFRYLVLPRFGRLRVLVILTLLGVASVVFAMFAFSSGPGSQVMQASDSVVITGNVQNCDLTLRVYPEKRIPATGNWGNTLHVVVTEVGGSPTVLDYAGLVTNNSGEGTIDLCDEGVILFDQDYDFYITGDAHLRKLFAGEQYLNSSGLVNLTTGGRVLLAGDTNAPKDEYINSLDISTQLRNFYSGNSHNDLNQDGIVNALDLSETIHNFYTTGD